MDKLDKAVKAGGVRVKQSKKPEKKKEGASVQTNIVNATNEGAYQSPAMHIGSDIDESKKQEKRQNELAEKSTNAISASKKYPATYAPPPKPAKQNTHMQHNSKIQQPRKMN
mmetsp:Transcript_13142/g.18228  ORF Transcript_13142/g.18228 Transcript_13142/m.18228 type:complete len:112 (-) Transcript_13142:84-419(-)